MAAALRQQDHERVFELFRRSGNQDQPGEGIGLAHVRIMARNLGGDITLKSELGTRDAPSRVTLLRTCAPSVRSRAMSHDHRIQARHHHHDRGR